MRVKKKKYKLVRNYLALGAFLKRARERREITQREVAKQLGYTSGQHISNMEAGIMVPPLWKWPTLLKLYNLKADEPVALFLACERERMLKEIL